MNFEVLAKVGVYFLYFISGGSFVNCLIHLNLAFIGENLSEKYKGTYMATHIGNAIAAIISLAVALGIPLFLGFKFGINLETLILFLGVIIVIITFAARGDKKKK